MGIYFGVLKEEASYSKVKLKLVDFEIVILNYYPKLRIVKFETDKKISITDFDFFVTIEEETDFIAI